MKTLKLKNETAAPKVYRGNEIRTQALEQLRQFAFFEGELLYKSIIGKLPNYEEDEELVICVGDLSSDIVVNVETGNTYDENTIFERVEVAEIVLCLDKTIIIRNEDGDEWNDWEISFDDVVKIVNILEESYALRCKGLM